MDLRACPRCGAPLPAGAPGAVESCRFCGAEGRSRDEAARSEAPAAPTGTPVCADGETVASLCDRFVAAVRAHASDKKARSEGDERLMCAIEDRMPIPDARRAEFRREMMNLVEALAVQGKAFEAGTNARVLQALEQTLAEDRKSLP